MALVDFDGFEHYAGYADMAARGGAFYWSTPSDSSGDVAIVDGRLSGKAVSIIYSTNGGLKANLRSGLSAGICGVCLKMPETEPDYTGGFDNYFALSDSANSQRQLLVSLNREDHSVSVYAGGEVYNLGTLLFKSKPNRYGYEGWVSVEIKTKIDNAAGIIVVRVDEKTICSLYNVQTQFASNAFFDQVSIATQNVDGFCYADDFYVEDTTVGPGKYPCNTFLGAVHSTALFPLANKGVDFTPKANANWQEVSEIAFDGDTSYNSSGTVNDKDIFRLGIISPVSSIVAVKATIGSKADSGFATLKNVIQLGGTDYPGDAQTQIGSYAYYQDIWTLSPADSDNWSFLDILNFYAGYKLTVVSGDARVSQFLIEVLAYIFTELPVLPIYPTLPGLTYSSKWSPNYFNAPTETTSSGADIDLGLSNLPIHSFELVYSVMRDNYPSAGSSEFKTLFGFFSVIGGTRGRFLYKNPDDYQVTTQAIATTDGTSRAFGPIVRTYGTSDFSLTEPVGQVDTDSTVNVYLDGDLQDPSTYTIITTTSGDNLVQFTTIPDSGKAITMDFNFYYYCKFADNTYSFEKFMSQLWSLGSINLKSCRAGA